MIIGEREKRTRKTASYIDPEESMKFSIDRRYLQDKLSTAARAVSPFSPLPALSGILIDVREDRIVFTGSDSNVAIQTAITPGEMNRLQIESTGSVCVESKYILDIVRKLDCDTVGMELMDYTLVRLTTENGTFNINSSSADEYPFIDFSRPQGHFVLSPDEFRQIVSSTAFACSDKDSRPVLSGVNFRIAGNELHCSGTDTYRLARKTLQLNQDQTFDITISARTLNEVMKSLSDSDSIDIFADRRKIQFVFGKTIIQSRLLDGTFPPVDRIIPTEFVSRLTVDTQELFRAIDRTNFMKNDNVHLIKLDCSEQAVRIKVRAAEIGNSDERLKNASWTGEPMSVTLNGSYVLDALKALKGEQTEFAFSGQLKPIRIMDTEDASTLMVVVPVRSFD